MERRHMGRSGLNVPVLSFGTGTFGGKGPLFGAWGNTDAREARRLVDVCLEAGITMFDTADVYSNGASEKVLGEALEGRRDRAIISTKTSLPMGDGPDDAGSSRSRLIRACEAALRRLGTDYIDLLQLHAFDAGTPDRRGPLDARRPRSGWKGSLRRRVELFRLAPDEVARDRGAVRIPPVHCAPGLLLARRSRLRVGAHAARSRSRRRSCCVEPARLGSTHGPCAARPAASGAESAPFDRGLWTSRR